MVTIQCQCGETYRSEEQHIGKNIKCKKCGSILSIIKPGTISPVIKSTGIPQEINASTVIDPHSKPEYSERIWWRKHLYSLIVFAVLLGIFLFDLVSKPTSNIEPSYVAPSMPAKTSNTEKPQKEYSPLQVVPVEPVNPKRLPNGSSAFGPGVRSGHSILIVDNGTETDAIVKVIRLRDRDEQVRNFYVQQGSKWTANKIPSGRYVLRVAFGRDWNSKAHKFNFRRSFSESENFDISETTSVTQNDDGQLTETKSTKMSITLHKVLMGNFKSHEINEEDFDR